MASKHLRNLKHANLLITNKTLKIDYPYVVYQINNITSMDKRFRKPNYWLILNIVYQHLVALFITFVFLGFINAIFKNPTIVGSLALLFIVLLIFLMIKNIIDLLQKKVEYSVSIFTNDGKSVTIPSNNGQFIDNIMSRIYEVMENEDTPVNYHFEVEGDIIQQNGHFGVGVNRGTIN